MQIVNALLNWYLAFKMLFLTKIKMKNMKNILFVHLKGWGLAPAIDIQNRLHLFQSNIAREASPI